LLFNVRLLQLNSDHRRIWGTVESLPAGTYRLGIVLLSDDERSQQKLDKVELVIDFNLDQPRGKCDNEASEK